LIGGATSMAKAVNDNKIATTARRTATSWSFDRTGPRIIFPYKYGCGLYLCPYKRGQGVAAKKQKRQKDDKNTVWYNYQSAIERARETCAYHTLEAFSCVIRYRQRRASKRKRYRESGRGLLLISAREEKQPRHYFNSFGNLQSPKELVRYIGNYDNRTFFQSTYDQSFCG